MTSLTRDIWGNVLDVEVQFEDLDDEGISLEQWNAFGNLILSWESIDDALPAVKSYCEADDLNTAGETIDNILRCVVPRYLFIPGEQKERTAALMCDYEFDPEHGLALVFENEALKEIGPQDIIL